MKDAIKEIRGKTIEAVVCAKNNPYPPQNQIFLIFDDGTYYEIYGDDAYMSSAGGIDKGDAEAVKDYVQRSREFRTTGKLSVAEWKRAMKNANIF